MSDEDERQTNLNMNSFYENNNRRLSAIKSKLQELTREKTKYNVEKLTQDIDFLQSELEHLSHTIADLNKEIIGQIHMKKTLNAKMAMLRSNSGLRYPSLEVALHDKERYEKELEKPKKSEVYRDLARRHIKTINEALPQLQIQDEFHKKLQQAEDRQIAAQDKREKLQEILNTKSRKQAEFRQLLNDSTTKLPELEADIENLRLERETISTSITNKKQRYRSSTIQPKQLDSPVQSFASLEQDTLDYEKQRANEQLQKIRLLLKYFYEKMSEHNLTMNDQSSSELISPLSNSLTPLEEQTILSSYMNEKDLDTYLLNNAIAMKLPKNLLSLDINSLSTNEIIHSTDYPLNLIEYKKELPTDIIDKYAGITNKKEQQQQQNQTKKNKKHKKNCSIKHSSQIVVLYNDFRKSTDNSDTLPYMPLYEYELPTTIKSLQLMEQSVESYLNELSKREQNNSSISINEIAQDDDDDDIGDSALDTYSETSSLIEPITISKDSTSIIPQLINIPEARSSSSSDDKKTIVSSASPPSSHNSHSKIEHQSLLTTVEESPSYIPPLTVQISQIERQISDEGYRSVRNETQQTKGSNNNLPLLIRSKSYDCTEKVDKWLSSSNAPLSLPNTYENFHLNNHTDFQATNIDNEEEIINSGV